MARLLAGQAEVEFQAVSNAFFQSHAENEAPQSHGEDLGPDTHEFFRSGVLKGLRRRMDDLEIQTVTSLAKAGLSIANDQTRLAIATRNLVHQWKHLSMEVSTRCADQAGEIETLKEKIDVQRFTVDDMHREMHQEIQDLYALLKTKDVENNVVVIGLEDRIKEREERFRILHAANEDVVIEQARRNRKDFNIPTLRVAGEAYLASKKENLHESSRELAYLRHRFELFMDLIGDRPLDDYNLQDLTDFAIFLKFLPANHSVKPKWRHMSPKQIILLNKSAGRIKDDEGLTKKTIVVNYLGKIKTIFSYVCARYGVRNPFKDSKPLVPEVSKPSVVRGILPMSSVEELFKYCSKRRRPDERYLPLLGMMTGARLSELVFLQAKDIYIMKEHYVANLITPIVTESGEVRRRPTKNEGSRRIIVLHESLRAAGFIDWALSQRGWLFPELHADHIKRPGDAASKRFQRLFRTLLIHNDRSEVFHSLRHSYKDWVRDCNVPDRTIDIQTGHVLQTNGGRYGSKGLRVKEITTLATLALPTDLNHALDFYRRQALVGIPETRPLLRLRRAPRRVTIAARNAAVANEWIG